MVFYLKHVLTDQRFNLGNGIHFLGDSGECNVILTYDNMSDIQAVVVVSNGRIFLKDMESTHGTYLNSTEQRLGTAFYELFVGDNVSFGVGAFGHEPDTPPTYGCFTLRSDEIDFVLDLSNSAAYELDYALDMEDMEEDTEEDNEEDTEEDNEEDNEEDMEEDIEEDMEEDTEENFFWTT
ncbi:uncharacterized protein LOC117146553 [Drosophila mauritiana]|uniref:Uncharacterized protein LOC117146553 n=1 Tax=Drosophila mauritiana TaxID=7226 RepID=A0A6P8L007_DROMA|nr:uncharacterized protein LOC117146553 [Drosophila mauritiana]